MFRFKHFTVNHDQCAMKVNTDGVLLGAWVRVLGVHTVLDVGTGSGLISLMLAQRGVGHIDAVEIEHAAARQAAENFAESAWAGRLYVHAMRLQDFMPQRKYDLVVSNPPYFNKSLKTPDEVRNLARHNDSLPLDVLARFAAQWLQADGRLALILPVELTGLLLSTASQHGLWPKRKCSVRGREGAVVKRVLWELVQHPCQVEETEMAIEVAPLQFTHDYKALTKDFYLAF